MPMQTIRLKLLDVEIEGQYGGSIKFRNLFQDEAGQAYVWSTLNCNMVAAPAKNHQWGLDLWVSYGRARLEQLGKWFTVRCLVEAGPRRFEDLPIKISRCTVAEEPTFPPTQVNLILYPG